MTPSGMLAWFNGGFLRSQAPERPPPDFSSASAPATRTNPRMTHAIARPPPGSRVFSGMQPSGEAHLGNYLGALRQWAALQEDYDCVYCIVDQHAITGPYDPEALPGAVFDLAVGFLASGIDPERSVVFVQSDVPEHTELSWLFNSVAPIGDLERMIQFKEKSGRMESVPVGLLNYPVLQAADILLYRADVVPVGEDQRQHLELTRDIARKWNARFGAYLPEPRPHIPRGGRILGLDGRAKMSKSLGNTVGILDEPDGIRKRVRGAVTDPARIRRTDPGRPEACNVFSLHEHFADRERIEDIALRCRTAERGCVECKGMLAEEIDEAFAPMREVAAHYRAHPEEVRRILDDGARRAGAIAKETMAEVRSRMGLDWKRNARAPMEEAQS